MMQAGGSGLDELGLRLQARELGRGQRTEKEEIVVITESRMI